MPYSAVGRPDFGMDPEQEKRERAVTLAKAVKAAKGFGPGVGGGCGTLFGTGTLFGAAFVVTRLPVSGR